MPLRNVNWKCRVVDEKYFILEKKGELDDVANGTPTRQSGRLKKRAKLTASTEMGSGDK